MTTAIARAGQTAGIHCPSFIAMVNASAFARDKAAPAEARLRIDRETVWPHEDEEPDVTTTNQSVYSMLIC